MRLSDRPNNDLELSCTAGGFFLGRTPLIERRDGGYFILPQAELERLLNCAYGGRISVDGLMQAARQCRFCNIPP